MPTIIIAKRAKRFLKNLTDAKLRHRLEDKIQSLSQHPAVPNVEKIKGADCAYRLRVGSYRIVYDYTGSLVIILDIDHRKDVYR